MSAEIRSAFADPLSPTLGRTTASADKLPNAE